MSIKTGNLNSRSNKSSRSTLDVGTNIAELSEITSDLDLDLPNGITFSDVTMEPVSVQFETACKVAAFASEVPNNEFAMIGKHNDGEVNSLWFPEQEGSGSTVDILQGNPDEEDLDHPPLSNCGVYLHSHHNMSATFSGTDHNGVNDNFDISILVAWANGPKDNPTPGDLDWTASRKVRINEQWYKAETNVEIQQPDLDLDVQQQAEEKWSKLSRRKNTKGSNSFYKGGGFDAPTSRKNKTKITGFGSSLGSNGSNGSGTTLNGNGGSNESLKSRQLSHLREFVGNDSFEWNPGDIESYDKRFQSVSIGGDDVPFYDPRIIAFIDTFKAKEDVEYGVYGGVSIDVGQRLWIRRQLREARCKNNKTLPYFDEVNGELSIKLRGSRSKIGSSKDFWLPVSSLKSNFQPVWNRRIVELQRKGESKIAFYKFAKQGKIHFISYDPVSSLASGDNQNNGSSSSQPRFEHSQSKINKSNQGSGIGYTAKVPNVNK